MKPFYMWEDANDMYATGQPDFSLSLSYGEVPGFPSKAAARADFKRYVAEGGFDWKPKFRLFRVTVEEVK